MRFLRASVWVVAVLLLHVPRGRAALAIETNLRVVQPGEALEVTVRMQG